MSRPAVVLSGAGARAAGAVRPCGLGLDLVDAGRFRKLLAAWRGRFLARVFLESERRYCEARAQPWLHYAARFAVKEAVAKAFGLGIGGALGWHDIEVRCDPASGAPSVVLSVRGRRLAARRGVGRILVSLSHTPAVAAAAAVLVAEDA